MSSLSSIFDCFTPFTYDAFSAHLWPCETMGKIIKYIFGGRVPMPFITLHHICSGQKIVETHFLTRTAWRRVWRKNHMVNLLPLCQEKPLEVSHSVAPDKVGNSNPETPTVRFPLLKCFQNLPSFPDLRVIEKANQRDRPVRKPAAWTGQEPADEIHPYFSLMMTWLIFPQSAQM